MKERKHKWGKRNKARIAAGLPPITQREALTPDFITERAPAGSQAPQTASTVSIQAGVIEELTDRITALEKTVCQLIPLEPGDFLRYQPVKEQK